MNALGQLLLLTFGSLTTATVYLVSLSVIKLLSENNVKIIDKSTKYFLFNKIRPTVTQFLARNIGVKKLLHRRLTTSKFSGLPLTLMVFAALYIFAIASEFLVELLQADKLVVIDQAINSILEPTRGWPLINIFAWITLFGNTQTVIAVCIVISAFLWVFKKTEKIIPLWITIIGSITTTWIGKYVIGRERPDPIDGFLALSPSFPSAHATIATAVYGFLAYLIARDAKQLRVRFEIVYWSTIVIGLIGFSRIYLRYHYTSDVITGFLVGGFWLLVGFIIIEYRRMPSLE